MAKDLPNKHWHLEHGQASEQLAARYLQAQGLILIARNLRFKVGELDLVCLDDHMLVIVEVRQRRSEQFGGALASVTPWKQRKIIRAAQYFIQHASEWSHLPMRFDVIAINGLPDRAPQIAWVKHAFTV